MQTLPAVSSQLDKRHIGGSGQMQLEDSVLQELPPSAADSRSNNSKRRMHCAAQTLPTAATPPEFASLFPRETSQTHSVGHCAKPADNVVWDSQQHLGRQLHSPDSNGRPLTVQKCRHWWPAFDAHTAHSTPKAFEPYDFGEHGRVQNDNNWSSAAEPAVHSPLTLARQVDAETDGPAAPQWLQEILKDNKTSPSTGSSAQAEQDHPQAGGLVTSPLSSSNSKHHQLRQQAVASFDKNASGSSADSSWASDTDQAASSLVNKLSLDANVRSVSGDFPKEAVPALRQLAFVFSTLPFGVVVNAMRQAAYDHHAAGDQCLDLMNGPGDAWSDSGSPSDGDSVAAESHFDTSSPLHSKGSIHELLDPSESLQGLDFDVKVMKLHDAFPGMDFDQLEYYLRLAAGSFDTAYAHLLNDMEERQQQQKQLEQQALEDLKFARQLASEDTAPPEEPEASKLDMDKLRQDAEAESLLAQLTAKDPTAEANLQILTDRFPTHDRASLVNLLGAVESVEAVIQIVESSSESMTTEASKQPTSAPISSSAASSYAAGNAVVGRAVVGPSPVYDAGRPISPPPGFSTLRTQAPKPIQAPRHTAKQDIYHDARLKFKEAQEHIVQCNRDFHAARRCNDTQAQKRLSSQLAYWQNVAKEEKLRASKKIFTSKNAEVTNTYKLDLHALHVDEAIEKIQETRRDLRKFPCTWQVEAVTGKGLHSVGNEPKLLPAVKHFLDSEGIPWWPGNPGMVVFQLSPKPEES